MGRNEDGVRLADVPTCLIWRVLTPSDADTAGQHLAQVPHANEFGLFNTSRHGPLTAEDDENKPNQKRRTEQRQVDGVGKVLARHYHMLTSFDRHRGSDDYHI